MLEGQAWVVLKYEHIKMGRGSAQIKVKIRNIRSGSIVEKSFQNGAKVDEVMTMRRPRQFLYRDGSSFVFMDPRSFEQAELAEDVIGDQEKFLTEGLTCNVVFLEEEGKEVPLSIELPLKMDFAVVETDPGVKGDSAVNIYKPAKLSNGMTVKVPLFVNEGERVTVDTRSGEYVGRAG